MTPGGTVSLSRESGVLSISHLPEHKWSALKLHLQVIRESRLVLLSLLLLAVVISTNVYLLFRSNDTINTSEFPYVCKVQSLEKMLRPQSPALARAESGLIERMLNQPIAEVAIVMMITNSDEKDHFYDGMMTLIHSIRYHLHEETQTYDIVVLISSFLSNAEDVVSKLRLWNVRAMIVAPLAYQGTRGQRHKYFNWTVLHIWSLTAYKRIVYMDTDMLVTGDISPLLWSDLSKFSEEKFIRSREKLLLSDFSAMASDYVYLAVAPNFRSKTNSYEIDLFNGGLLITEPDAEVYELLVMEMKSFRSPTGGVQPFLNQIFPRVHWMDRHIFNVNTQSLLLDSMKPYLQYPRHLHYTWHKPWLYTIESEEPAIRLWHHYFQSLQECGCYCDYSEIKLPTLRTV